ncbi:MAG: porin, partial [Porticoccaceae bacterium]
DTWKLNSNASRIGLKGSTQVSEGLNLFYKTEFEVDVDGDGDLFKHRNIYAGLKGSFGSILAGNNDTPTKLSQKKVDLFNDLEGDIKKTFDGENRRSNLIAYTTPKHNGFSATYATMQNDGGLGDAQSYSVSYNKDGFYLAVASDNNVKNKEGNMDLTRIVSQINVNSWQLGFMYQENDTQNEHGHFVSAAHKVDNYTYKVQYGENGSKTTFSAGVDTKLSKNTKTFLFLTDNTSSTAFGLGLEHKF